MNAPERLLYHPDFTQQVVVSLPEGRASIPHTEYVRADLFAALEAEKQAQITELALQCLATDGQAEEALARAEKAEALLKEAVEALKYYRKQMCEGFCNSLQSESQYSEEMYDDCAGCKSRATLAKIEEQGSSIEGKDR
jgi:hypothetical protein